jgi:hypothetical protein
MSYEDLMTDSEPDRIIMYGDWVTAVILDVIYGENEDLESDLAAHFEIDSTDYLGDPNEPFYQGSLFTRIITRKSDGRKFGYSFWAAKGHDGFECEPEPNGDANGLEKEWIDDDSYCPIWVWLPVAPFTITGYKVVEPVGGSDE